MIGGETMKRARLWILVLAVGAVLGGCKHSRKETEAPTEAPTETQVMTEAPTEAPTEPPTEREDSMNKTRQLKGLVKESNASSLTIQTERGKELEFSITGADIQLPNGIQNGINVTLLYKGKISGDDTSDARVLMVLDLAEGETPVTEGEPMTESAEADPNAGEGTLSGTIEDVNTDRIVILADDGESYYFSAYQTAVNLVNGLQEGNYVTVRYNGDIYGPDLVLADSITDNDPAAGDDTVTAGPSASGNYSYAGGTVTAYTTDTVSITTDEGLDITFDTTEATHCYENGILAGNYVTVEYTGSLEDGDGSDVKAVAVYDYTDDGADQSSQNGSEQNSQSGSGQDAESGSDENGASVSDTDDDAV